MGSFVGHEQIDVNIKQKGIPFLKLDISNLGILYCDIKDSTMFSFGIKNFSIVQYENPNLC